MIIEWRWRYITCYDQQGVRKYLLQALVYKNSQNDTPFLNYIYTRVSIYKFLYHMIFESY